MDATKRKKKRKQRGSKSLVDQLDAEYGARNAERNKTEKEALANNLPRSGKKRPRDGGMNSGFHKSKNAKIDELPLVTTFLQNALQFGCKIPEHKAKAIIASKVTGKVILLDNPQRDKDRSIQETMKNQRRRKRKDRKRMGATRKRELGLFDFDHSPHVPIKTAVDAKMEEAENVEPTSAEEKPKGEPKQTNNKKAHSGQKKGGKNKKNKKNKKNQKNQKAVVDYKKHLPLLRMWQTYMADLICKEANNSNSNNNNNNNNNSSSSSNRQHKRKDSQHSQQRWTSDVLLNADYHGCEFTVTQSRCPSYVGVTGIVLQETQNTFKIVTPKNELKLLPKANSMFAFTLHDKTFILEGDVILQSRSL